VILSTAISHANEVARLIGSTACPHNQVFAAESFRCRYVKYICILVRDEVVLPSLRERSKVTAVSRTWIPEKLRQSAGIEQCGEAGHEPRLA